MRVEEISDPDERLDFWAANTLIWGKPAPLVAYAQWLREGDTDRWHDAAKNWNWDYGLTPIWWIVNQQSCDAATALEIFYLAEPFYDGLRNREDEELLACIRERWTRGGFPIGSTRFNLPDYTVYRDQHFDLVPQSMRCSLPGREPGTVDYEDGLPLHLYGDDAVRAASGPRGAGTAADLWERVAAMLEQYIKKNK